jgi:endonuclease III related protein
MKSSTSSSPRSAPAASGIDVPTRRAPDLSRIFERLFARWGPQDWWPGETRPEIVIGAVLTQNTAWTNVERALDQLRAAGALDFRRIHRMEMPSLAQLIRSSGYFNQKARRLKSLAAFLEAQYGGSLERWLALPTDRLRRELLDRTGIGPETADSILLYAANRPVFVIDAYTRRALARHGWMRPRAPYEEAAAFFTSRLPGDAKLFNEFHALFVRLGKEHCRGKPLCNGCPLQPFLPRVGPRPATPR